MKFVTLTHDDGRTYRAEVLAQYRVDPVAVLGPRVEADQGRATDVGGRGCGTRPRRAAPMSSHGGLTSSRRRIAVSRSRRHARWREIGRTGAPRGTSSSIDEAATMTVKADHDGEEAGWWQQHARPQFPLRSWPGL